MSPRFGGPGDDDKPKPVVPAKAPSPDGNAAADARRRAASSASHDETVIHPSANQPDPISLEPYLDIMSGPKATPIHIPKRLMEAFRSLNADPILVGGSAVQVWTGRFDDIFETGDLDFITHLHTGDFVVAGIEFERTGRHVVVDGVAIEFPSGPLGVGNLYLDPVADTVLIPTLDGDQVRCIRPEACVLDRLAQVAGWEVSAAFLQASAVVVTQSEGPGWDQAWIDRNAPNAGLGKMWEFLKAELDNPSADGAERALKVGWDPPRAAQPKTEAP